MSTTNKIDHIDYGGNRYEFVDQVARNEDATINTKINRLDDKIVEKVNEEKTRAQQAEQALEQSKVSIVAGKGLSKNDFTDEYKDLLDNPLVFEGATSEEDGSQGDVPAPEAGDQDKFLMGDGTWATPHDTTYDDVTQSHHGLMTAADKIKLDGMDAEPDDVQASSTTFSSNTITETLGNGKTKTTVFNADGTITQTITKSGAANIVLKTTFNADGSITRTRT